MLFYQRSCDSFWFCDQNKHLDNQLLPNSLISKFFVNDEVFK